MGGFESKDRGNADGVGSAGTECGDLVEFHLWTADGRVAMCDFRMEGCQNTLRAAATAAAFARGRLLADVLGLQKQPLLELVGPLPPGTEHVADLVLRALHAAVVDAYRTSHEPWKKAYRRT